MNTCGFDVAEHDLNTRGAGTYLGTKQSGLPDNYRVTDINDIMNNIQEIKNFTYNLPSAKIKELKKRWNIKKIDEVQLQEKNVEELTRGLARQPKKIVDR